MIKGYLDNWKNLDSNQNLLFFAQLINELIYDYSIPSNRVATLNSHYLCFDALSTIGIIEENGVPEGTLKPIIAELYSSLQKDAVFDNDEIKPIDLFIKQNGLSFHKVSNTDDLNFVDSKKIIISLYQKYFKGRDYCLRLKKRLSEIIYENDINKQNLLFNITKSFITELINGGYSQQYIFDQLTYCFFNRKSGTISFNKLKRFLDIFTFDENSYSVFFIADSSFETISKQYKEYQIYDQLSCKTKLKIEERFLEKQANERFFVVNKINAPDPFSAAEKLIHTFQIQSSFYRLNNHNLQFEIIDKKIGIYDSTNYFTKYKHPKSVVKKTHNVPDELIEKTVEKCMIATSSALKTNFIDGQSIIKAVNFHALSLDTSSNENQLLDLWAIFETLLNISNKHSSDRIQQIISILVPVLKQRYLFELFSQLKTDIQYYSKKIFSEILSAQKEQNEVVAITNFVLLDEYRDLREKELKMLNDFPLLRERIIYYNSLLSKKSGIFQFINKHSIRIQWQIMRIYRNRNLIIHNGTSMPYLPLLIENLHSYVDTFMNYFIDEFAKNKGKEQIYQELFLKEYELLLKINNKKELVDFETIKHLLT